MYVYQNHCRLLLMMIMLLLLLLPLLLLLKCTCSFKQTSITKVNLFINVVCFNNRHYTPYLNKQIIQISTIIHIHQQTLNYLHTYFYIKAHICKHLKYIYMYIYLYTIFKAPLNLQIMTDKVITTTLTLIYSLLVLFSLYNYICLYVSLYVCNLLMVMACLLAGTVGQ